MVIVPAGAISGLGMSFIVFGGRNGAVPCSRFSVAFMRTSVVPISMLGGRATMVPMFPR